MSLPRTPERDATADDPTANDAAPQPAVQTTATVPADPAAYDSERSAAARRRGLAAPYIPGGRDPDQEQAELEDRRYLRILVIMVIAIVLAGFVLGILAALAGLDALVGNPG